MDDQFDCIVIGAGVVGLAVARHVALTGRSVLVLERHDAIGTETSSRNSEVIHAGIYYRPGSLKALLCVRGKALLYEYLAERELPHKRIGKLIVAVTDGERQRLADIMATAEENGVTDLVRIDSRELSAREPAVRGVEALWSPSTGILDVHALMLSLLGDLEAAGGIVALNATVSSGKVDDKTVRLTVDSDGEAIEIEAATVINCAGLGAAELAASIEGSVTPPPTLRPTKGNYFTYAGASPFGTLIYPLPADGGLGIHATLDMGGRVRFGPDVEWLESPALAVDPARAASFYAAIRTYWPDLAEGMLEPGYAGIRPKLSGPGEPPADFRIVESSPKGSAHLIQLFGIESPGLTSALAIAERVGAMIWGQ